MVNCILVETFHQKPERKEQWVDSPSICGDVPKVRLSLNSCALNTRCQSTIPIAPTSRSHSPSTNAPEMDLIGFEFVVALDVMRLQVETTITEVKIIGRTWTMEALGSIETN